MNSSNNHNFYKKHSNINKANRKVQYNFFNKILFQFLNLLKIIDNN
jgi:hypothetical protein